MDALREAARNAPRPDSAELELRRRLRLRWKDQMVTWEDFEAYMNAEEDRGYLYWSNSGRRRAPRCLWTTKRMFDGKFWSMQFVYRQSGEHAGRYVLQKTSVRYHAKRKDAKARALELHRAAK
jgi:hypothetical protein